MIKDGSPVSFWLAVKELFEEKKGKLTWLEPCTKYEALLRRKDTASVLEEEADPGRLYPNSTEQLTVHFPCDLTQTLRGRHGKSGRANRVMVGALLCVSGCILSTLHLPQSFCTTL